MTNSQQTKVPMHAVKVSCDPAPSSIPSGSDSEVVPRARRRTFTNAVKRRILQAADLCAMPGLKADPARVEALQIAQRSVFTGGS